MCGSSTVLAASMLPPSTYEPSIKIEPIPTNAASTQPRPTQSISTESGCIAAATSWQLVQRTFIFDRAGAQYTSMT